MLEEALRDVHAFFSPQNDEVGTGRPAHIHIEGATSRADVTKAGINLALWLGLQQWCDTAAVLESCAQALCVCVCVCEGAGMCERKSVCQCVYVYECESVCECL